MDPNFSHSGTAMTRLSTPDWTSKFFLETFSFFFWTDLAPPIFHKIASRLDDNDTNGLNVGGITLLRGVTIGLEIHCTWADICRCIGHVCVCVCVCVGGGDICNCGRTLLLPQTQHWHCPPPYLCDVVLQCKCHALWEESFTLVQWQPLCHLKWHSNAHICSHKIDTPEFPQRNPLATVRCLTNNWASNWNSNVR